eukprot:scaffold1168_cov265-Pinguiococcus_pyrenoidosus.AAC.1
MEPSGHQTSSSLSSACSAQPEDRWRRLPKRLCTAQRRHAAITPREEILLGELAEAYWQQFVSLDHLMDELDADDEDWELCRMLEASMGSIISLAKQAMFCSTAAADFTHLKRQCTLWYPFTDAILSRRQGLLRKQ